MYQQLWRPRGNTNQKDIRRNSITSLGFIVLVLLCGTVVQSYQNVAGTSPSLIETNAIIERYKDSNHTTPQFDSNLGTRFIGCSMTNFGDFWRSVGANEDFMDFTCKRVILPNNAIESVNKTTFFDYKEMMTYTRLTPSGPDIDICSKLGKWDNTLEVNCSTILCTNPDIDGVIFNATHGETSKYEWVNYCRYCAKNYTFTKCNDTAKYVPPFNGFPMSAMACGIELG